MIQFLSIPPPPLGDFKSYYHCVNDDTPCTVLYPSFLFTILHSSQNPTVHLDRHIQPNPCDPVRRDIYNCRRSLVIMVHPLKILLTYILGYYWPFSPNFLQVWKLFDCNLLLAPSFLFPYYWNTPILLIL